MSNGIAMSLSDRLRHAAAVRGLSQRELAERSGVKFRSLQEYLARRRMPADVLPRLAKVLNVSCDWLLTGEPADLDAATLWAALDRATSRLSCPVPVTEEIVHGFYYEYAWQYLLRLSPPGGVYPQMDQVDGLVKSFIERMEADTGPAMTMMRRKASGV